jgi:hypothetical protein
MAIIAVIAAKRFWQMSPDFKAFFEQINSARRRKVSRQGILLFWILKHAYAYEYAGC